MIPTCLRRPRVLPLQALSLLHPIKSHGLARAHTTTATMKTEASLYSLVLRPTAALVVSSSHPNASNTPQRSEEWFALRKDKLTTSTFSTALGFWKGNRRSELWHEKVFSSSSAIPNPSARSAMDWGTVHEAEAIEQYKAITGWGEVGSLGFATHPDAHLGWLGASPDGILGVGPNGGLLEVKCPYNKGRPELALPWPTVPYYYMPQVQGQMEIMDRDWVDMYCWTPSGSAVFRVERDRDYWELMRGILCEFWWESVVPAREAVLAGEEVGMYKPKPRHRRTGLVIVRSRELAVKARLVCREIGDHVEFFR